MRGVENEVIDLIPLRKGECAVCVRRRANHHAERKAAKIGQCIPVNLDEAQRNSSRVDFREVRQHLGRSSRRAEGSCPIRAH